MDCVTSFPTQSQSINVIVIHTLELQTDTFLQKKGFLRNKYFSEKDLEMLLGRWLNFQALMILLNEYLKLVTLRNDSNVKMTSAKKSLEPYQMFLKGVSINHRVEIQDFFCQ